jgi:serine/threonine-protein kinase
MTVLKSGNDLASRSRSPTDWYARRLLEVECLASLDSRLSAFVKGQARPADAAECLLLAQLCRYRRLYATAARLAAEALAAEPRLVAEQEPWHRYNGACWAAMAGTGRGLDAAQLAEPDRSRLRAQALDWLRADLVLLARRLTRGTSGDAAEVRRTLQHWQTDSDLAGVRDAALGEVPDPERPAWAALWAEVAELQKKAARPA